MRVLDTFRLDGKTAVVTGGGLGIGYGMAMGIAEAGANVAVASRREAQLEAAGAKAVGMKTDVLQFEDVEAELAPKGIRVNCIAPGTVETEMLLETPHLESGQLQPMAATIAPTSRSMYRAVCSVSSA